MVQTVPPGMSVARRGALNGYVRTLAELMRLHAWEIEVASREPDDKGAVLAVNPDLRRMWAPLYVRSIANDELEVGFFDETPEEQRQDVVHELVHVLRSRSWLWVHDGSWRHQLAQREYDLVEEVYRDEMESETDWLARLLAPSMPMPPVWPE